MDIINDVKAAIIEGVIISFIAYFSTLLIV